MAEHPLVEKCSIDLRAGMAASVPPYEGISFRTQEEWRALVLPIIRAVLTWGYDGKLTDDEVQDVDWPWSNTNCRMDPNSQKVAARESATVVNAALLRDIEAK